MLLRFHTAGSTFWRVPLLIKRWGHIHPHIRVPQYPVVKNGQTCRTTKPTSGAACTSIDFMCISYCKRFCVLFPSTSTLVIHCHSPCVTCHDPFRPQRSKLKTVITDTKLLQGFQHIPTIRWPVEEDCWINPIKSYKIQVYWQRWEYQ